jgi:hypothetical protein
MPTVTETASQNARTVADQSQKLADQTVSSAQEAFEQLQGSYLTLVEAAFQASNRWYDLARVMLEQSEAASREGKVVFEKLAAQGREQQRIAVDLARTTSRTIQNSWLGVYSNGRKA